MSELEVRDLVVAHGDRVLVDGLSFRVDSGTIGAILGPSGIGKTSLLRVVAGIERPRSGRVLLGGSDITDLPAHRRRVGLVFQDNQLFPHLTVAENVAYGLRHNFDRAFRRSWNRSRVERRVAELLEVIGLADRGPDPVGVLSGGEAKRVALARGLASSPAALLLDEPLTGLDGELHDRLMHDLRSILNSAGTTALLVTHDETESSFLATSVTRLG
ncbi:MAG: ABC transporter ATP-binding protein [Actinomycetota bacterium]